jgi:hypothetical protein
VPLLLAALAVVTAGAVLPATPFGRVHRRAARFTTG